MSEAPAGEDEAEEILQVGKAQAGQLAGPGGAGPARTVEQRTGTQVLVERTATGASVTIRGPKAKVMKAVAMLKALVAFKEAASPEERGVCSWFACGFCRDADQEQEDGCQAGLHSSKSSAEIQAAWLAKAPKAVLEGGVVKAESRPLLLALSCWGGGFAPPLSGPPGSAAPGAPGRPNGSRGGIGCPEEDVLEFCLLAIDHVAASEVGRFHRFVRPVAWDEQDEDMRQKYAAECFADKPPATAFTDVLADLLDWLPGVLGVDIDDISPEDVLLVSARDFEIQTLLPRRCNMPEPGTVDVSLQDFFFSRWCCLKDAFRSHFALPNEAAPNSLRAMARHLGLPLSDQAKRTQCLDENALLMRVTLELLKKGWKPKATAWRDTASAQTQFLLPRRGDFPEGLERNFLPAKRGFEEVEALPPVVPPALAPGPPPSLTTQVKAAAPVGAFAKGVSSAPPAPWHKPQPLPAKPSTLTKAPSVVFDAVD